VLDRQASASFVSTLHNPNAPSPRPPMVLRVLIDVRKPPALPTIFRGLFI
jgi:hypothetical protein